MNTTLRFPPTTSSHFIFMKPSGGPSDTEIETQINFHYAGHFAFATLTHIDSTLQMKPIMIYTPTYEA